MPLRNCIRGFEAYFLRAYDPEDIRQYWRLRFALYSAFAIVVAVTAGSAIASRVLPLPALFLAALPLAGAATLVLLRLGLPQAVVIDLQLASFFATLAYLHLSGISGPIVMWFLVFPLLASLLRGPGGGLHWAAAVAGFYGWLFAFRWAGPEGMARMPDLFRHTWPVSIPISYLTLLTFYGIGVFADGALHAAMDKVMERNRELREENARRRKVEEELTAAIGVRERLLSVMSHDLVNPTWGLQSYITGLAEDETSGIGRSEILEIKRSIDRLCLMLENLLYWSRIQAGGIAPSPRLVDCGKVVAQETHFLADLASTKGITVTLKDEAGSLALTDEHLLRIVARNLIQNAIKFTPVSGAVEVETGREGAAPVVIVRDEGPGMPGDVFPAIERGAAISSARGSAGERGHGIGLAVCFELVRAVGGELSAAPRPGGGTTIRVRFGTRIEEAGA